MGGRKVKDFFLTSYSVKGIKTLDEWVTLSFYKKTITKNPDTQDYNIKGIYGMNGSGKSGIVTSVEILRNLLIDPGYLNNPVVQRNLDAIINKKTKELSIEVEYMAKVNKGLMLFCYIISLEKNSIGKYVIVSESLSSKKATSKQGKLETVLEIKNGEFVSIYKDSKDKLIRDFRDKTKNLLSTASMSALFLEKFLLEIFKAIRKANNSGEIEYAIVSLCSLCAIGRKIHVYLDQSDDYRQYLAYNSLGYNRDHENYDSELDSMISDFLKTENDFLNILKPTNNFITKNQYKYFEKRIQNLYGFLHIFKADLQSIEIEKKEDHNFWICDLVMVYKNYKIHAEFESTGIKKLIQLFAYIKEMVEGGIVFLDEFDSNLHDVYLCALLEYLMEYGKGQLCFTTHNVGPMDVLKQHKKSIDFLSEDHKIYQWKTSGNYSPSKLYRNGMIEGSPFNVDSIDFIEAFGSGEEDE